MADQGPVFEGLPEANAAISRWATQQLPKDFITDTRPIAQSMASQVAGKVPVLTGALQASVQALIVSNPDGAAIGMGNDEVPYADWIEFGGSRGRDYVPQGRYVYPTLEANQSQLQAASEQLATSSINRFPWPAPA